MRAAFKTRGYKGSKSAHRVSVPTEVSLNHHPRLGTVAMALRRLNGTEGEYAIEGIRGLYEKVKSPKGVLRYRREIGGTGQDTPCFSFFEIWASVEPLKGVLP